MPIIQNVSKAEPLSQGDILSGIKLFSTGLNNNGGESIICKSTLCLVLSRPCAITHKEAIVVAMLDKYQNAFPKTETLKLMIGFLTELRDGVESPDRMYLGEIPENSGKWNVRFDSIHQIQIPPNGSPEREKFITSHRIARLSTNFIHDLHVRLVRSFASLGFDDIRWLSDVDLGMVVAQGKIEINELNSEIERMNLDRVKSDHVTKGQHQKPSKEKLKQNKKTTTATTILTALH